MQNGVREEIGIAGPRRELQAVVHYPQGVVVHETCWLVMSHGFRGSKDGQGQAVELAEQVSARGMGVVRFDFTPCESLDRQVEELLCVTRWMQHQGWMSLVLLGRSMGGCASLVVAGQLGKRIKGLCLWATPGELQVTFQNALGREAYRQLQQGNSIELQDEWGCLQLNPDFIGGFAVLGLPEKLKALGPLPLLILHGTEDELVPVEQARVYASVAQGPCKLVVLEGADHRFSEHFRESAAAVMAWLEPWYTKISSSCIL
nr:alpha/beta hydrolase [uncultured Anaeromusa sp.]